MDSRSAVDMSDLLGETYEEPDEMKPEPAGDEGEVAACAMGAPPPRAGEGRRPLAAPASHPLTPGDGSVEAEGDGSPATRKKDVELTVDDCAKGGALSSWLAQPRSSARPSTSLLSLA